MASTEIANAQLIEALSETRTRTLALVADLSDAQLMGPRLQIVNPLLWEIGHIAWFQEYWVLRHLGDQPPILPEGDLLYDSARVAHDTRWDLPLLARDKTLAYMGRVLERVSGDWSRSLKDADGYDLDYFLNLVLLHEQMHDEALAYTRQTLSYPPPAFAARNDAASSPTAADLTSDAEVPGGIFTLGSNSEAGFTFDNELLAHDIENSLLQYPKPLSATGSSSSSSKTVATEEASFGARRDGSGGRVRKRNIRSTGNARETIDGCAAVLINGSRWKMAFRWSTLTGTKLMLIAAGRAGGWQQKLNGKWQRVACLRLMVRA